MLADIEEVLKFLIFLQKLEAWFLIFFSCSCENYFSNGTAGMLEEEQVETPTSPKSEPEEALEPEEQIPSQIETYEPVKEEPKVEPMQPEEQPQGNLVCKFV